MFDHYGRPVCAKCGNHMRLTGIEDSSATFICQGVNCLAQTVIALRRFPEPSVERMPIPQPPSPQLRQ